jgi:hypothetical protein
MSTFYHGHFKQTITLLLFLLLCWAVFLAICQNLSPRTHISFQKPQCWANVTYHAVFRFCYCYNTPTFNCRCYWPQIAMPPKCHICWAVFFAICQNLGPRTHISLKKIVMPSKCQGPCTYIHIHKSQCRENVKRKLKSHFLDPPSAV